MTAKRWKRAVQGAAGDAPATAEGSREDPVDGTGKGVSGRVAAVLERVVGVPTAAVTAAFFAIMAAASLLVTCYPRMGERPLMIESAMGSGAGVVTQVVAPLAVAVALLVAARRGIPVLGRLPVRRVVVASMALALVAQVAWTAIFMTGVSHFHDTVQLDALATALLRGDGSMFVSVSEWSGPVTGEGPSYLIRVPYQAGAVLLFAGVYALFGTGNLAAIQCVNVAANMVTVAAVVGISREAARATGRDADGVDRATKAAAVGACAFLPLLMSATFVYSNSVGLALASLSMWLSAWAWGRGLPAGRDVACLAGAGILLALAAMAKTTLVLLALAIVPAWCLHLLRGRRPAGLVVAAAVLVAVMQAKAVPIAALESMTGTDLGDGQPLAANVVIGLSWSDSTGLPGWYNDAAMDCWNETDGSMGEQSAWCRERLSERLSEWAGDPVGGAAFLGEKLATEWLDPTYQAMWFSQTNMDEGHWTEAAAVGAVGRRASVPLLVLMDGAQAVLYALAAAGLAMTCARAARRQTTVAELLLAGTALVGIATYALWEAQSMYAMPFALLLVPVAAAGAERLAGMRLRGIPARR